MILSHACVLSIGFLFSVEFLKRMAEKKRLKPDCKLCSSKYPKEPNCKNQRQHEIREKINKESWKLLDTFPDAMAMHDDTLEGFEGYVAKSEQTTAKGKCLHFPHAFSTKHVYCVDVDTRINLEYV